MPKYHIFNLVIDSRLPLSQFMECSSDAVVDVTIRIGDIGPAPQYVTPFKTRYQWISRRHLLLGWSNLGWYRVEDGSHITISPASDVNPEACLQPVFGLVFATLLQQRGEYVLHSSGVVKQDRAILFLGNKGDGKSTLASYLMTQGAEIISDDVASIYEHLGQKMLRPGFPLMKLWPNSLSNIGKEADRYERVAPEIEKRSVPVDLFCHQPKEIAGIFILRLGDELAVRRLSPQHGMPGLMSNMMASYFTEGRPEKVTRQHFEQMADILRATPVFELIRPHDLGLLNDTAKEIEQALSV